MGVIMYKDELVGAIGVSYSGENAIPPTTINLNCGDFYQIPSGTHGGQGKVIANDLKSQTNANAQAKYILEGRTAWANGEKIIGNMIDKTGWKIDNPSSLEKIFIPEGYHDGDGYINLLPVYEKGKTDGAIEYKMSPGGAVLIVNTDRLHLNQEQVGWKDVIWTNNIADGRVFIRCNHHSPNPYTDYYSFCYVNGKKVSEGYKNHWATIDTKIPLGGTVVFSGGSCGGVKDCIIFFYIPFEEE